MRRGKSRAGTMIFVGFFLAIVVATVYLANSPMFERNAPKIVVPNSLFWNLKEPIKIKLEDDSGIKAYRVILNDGSSDFVVAESDGSKLQNELEVTVELPKAGWNRRAAEAVMKIEVFDISKWNLMQGNGSYKEVKLYIDSVRPSAFVLANSYSITQGGSALVVFGAKDKNLKSVYVKTSFGKVFKPEPFYKEGYYVALIAWPVPQSNFRAWVEAIDYAGNVAKAHIPIFVRKHKYRRSNIALKDSFLNGKVADLAMEFDETANITDPLERFRIINEVIRKKNEELIHKIGSKVSDKLIRRWSVKPFLPLKNAKKVASFGDHRFYYYKGKKVSESYHLGLDLASVKMAKILLSNPGKVVYSGYNGIYGYMPMIDHGLGLYSLYGHCSTVHVGEGEELHRGDVIAKTGKTGLALGDHLHFGIVVQGVEVRPVEWMDANWIKNNITNVFETARKIIDRRSEQ